MKIFFFCSVENTVVSSGANVFALGHVEPGKFLTAVGESHL